MAKQIRALVRVLHVQMSRCTAARTVTSSSPRRSSCGGTRSIRAPVPAPSSTRWGRTSNRSARTATSPSTSAKTVRRSSRMSTGTHRSHHASVPLSARRSFNSLMNSLGLLIKSGPTYDSPHRGEGIQMWPVPQSLQLEVQPHPPPDVTWQWQTLWVWKLW